MEIQATIKVINDLRSGVSRTNGNPWKSQDIVIGWTENTPDGRTRDQVILVTLHGTSADIFCEKHFSVGDIITGDISFDTRSFNGRVFNDIALFLK